MATSTRRKTLALLGAVTVFALGLEVGPLSVPAAQAETPPITLALSAMDASSESTVEEVLPGTEYSYVASVGCPDPSGCGPASLKVDIPSDVLFREEAFRATPGATHEFTASQATGVRGGGVLTVNWASLDGTAVLFLPVQVDGEVGANLNDTSLVAEAILSAGEHDDAISVSSGASVKLTVYEKPGLADAAAGWDKQMLTKEDGATAKTTLSGTASANALSTLTFTVPGAASLGGELLAVSEAFDLRTVELSQNPGGAQIIFALPAGEESQQRLEVGELSAEAPQDALGYTVTAFQLPADGGATVLDRTISVTASYELRENKRAGGKIVGSGASSQVVRANADIKNTVEKPAVGSPAEQTTSKAADISITALAASIAHSLDITTTSGDRTSVYGSGEASTATARVANSGVPGVQTFTVDLVSGNNSSYFEYQEVVSAPEVHFPSGATTATIQYRYVGPDGKQTQGNAHAFTAGATVPGPGEDGGGHTLARVAGVTVTFQAAERRAIDGGCSVSDTCAGAVIVHSELRETRLSDGSEIVAPGGSSGETTVPLSGKFTAVTVDGGQVVENSGSATLKLVKPQLKVALSKRFGAEDGSDRVVDPLTGIATAGDLYDPDAEAKGFREHALTFEAATHPVPGATENVGAKQLRIMDPQIAPTLENLGSNPFNTIRFTQLAAAPAACVDTDSKPVASETKLKVWVLDALVAPKNLELVDFTDDLDPSLVVGYALEITPAGPERRFPVEVTCSSEAGAAVQFRENRVSDGEEVRPDMPGTENARGLIVENIAELHTGKNAPTALGRDALTLIHRSGTGVHKSFAQGADRFGIQGEESPTAFLISGVPVGSDSTTARLVDGTTSGTAGLDKSSFDVFAFVNAREAHVGPDQAMTVSFFDSNGTRIGPTGTVRAGSRLGNTQLTDDEIENSQSSNYLKYQRVSRNLSWNSTWQPDEKLKVAGVQVDVTRSQKDSALQEFGAFSVTLDVTLRNTFLSSPRQAVAGTPEGTRPGGGHYYNQVTSTSKRGTWTTPTAQSAEYKVYAAQELIAGGRATWSDAVDTADKYLVASHHTPSLITIAAENKTAVGTTALAEDQWKTPGSLSVGVEQLTAAVGGPAGGGRNPFAITDFVGISHMTWPIKNGALPRDSNAQRRVAAVITYSFANGDSEVIDAPVGADPSRLNPKDHQKNEVIGVSVTWKESGKTVAATAPNNQNTGQLSLRADLRDTVRDAFTYEFIAGNPKKLGGNDKIDGAVQEGASTNTQKTTFDLPIQVSLGELSPGSAHAVSNEMRIEVAKNSVALQALVSGKNLYRDRGSDAPTQWTVTNQNSGNISVSSQRIATDSALLVSEGWPNEDSLEFDVAAGSMFDAFDVTGVTVDFPRGAATARVWALGENKKWSDAMLLTGNSTKPVLPESGDGPKSWSEVIGLRVQFDADEGSQQRIAKRATSSLVITTVLREYLRSAPTVRAPADAVAEGTETWGVELTAAGTSYAGRSGTFLAPSANATARKVVHPGTPAPRLGKYLTKWSASTPAPATAGFAHPGTWVDYYLVLENHDDATSNLYELSLVDTLPPELTYNPASKNREWRVIDAPERFSQPKLTMGLPGASTMSWKWGDGDVLKPGERVQIVVPLLVRDGLSAGTTVANTARLVGSGIVGAAQPSVCAAVGSAAAGCLAQARVTTQRIDSVRAESFLEASAYGAALPNQERCDVTAVAGEWGDGEWVRPPCVVDTTVGAALTYRLKLINSGNSGLSELRFVDELPGVGDAGVVLNSLRESQWTPSLIPGSVRLLAGEEAAALGARGDGQLTGGGFRYTSAAKPCQLTPDAVAGASTLECTSKTGTWQDSPPELPRAIGGDISFGQSQLGGGEYVVVEFQLRVPNTSLDKQLAWNSVAVSGRRMAGPFWLPASESPKQAAQAWDSQMTVTLDLANDPATPWHLGASGYDVDVTCVPPGGEEPTAHQMRLPGIASLDGKSVAGASGLPRGSQCSVADERYEPNGATTPGHYGLASANPSGYRFTTVPKGPIVLKDDVSQNQIHMTNHFSEVGLDLGVQATGSAIGMLPSDIRFPVEMSCDFGGITQPFGPYTIVSGGTERPSGLPVGANCAPRLTHSHGASAVSGTFESKPTPLTSDHRMTLSQLAQGRHSAMFIAEFQAGGDVNVVKHVQLPRTGLAAGDVEFQVSCDLAGQTLDLGRQSTLRHSFAPGETEAVLPVRGVPAGAECTVHESVSGGSDLPSPDRTVTVLPQEAVYVEMTNVYSPGALQLTKRIAGPGAHDSRVPETFDVRASCTRELTIDGRLQTVTDFDGLTTLAPGVPAMLESLPAGATCTVTEPDLAGAASVSIVSRSDGQQNSSPAGDAADVTLGQPDADGQVNPARVEVTNTYAASSGLRRTGSQMSLGAGIIALLLLGLGGGALAVKRRKRRTELGE